MSAFCSESNKRLAMMGSGDHLNTQPVNGRRTASVLYKSVIKSNIPTMTCLARQYDFLQPASRQNKNIASKQAKKINFTVPKSQAKAYLPLTNTTMNPDNRIIFQACLQFITNAWRHKRSEVTELENHINESKLKVDNGNYQIFLLSTLIISDRRQLALLSKEHSMNVLRLKDVTEESEFLKTESMTNHKEQEHISQETASLYTEIVITKKELECKQKESLILDEVLTCEREDLSQIRKNKLSLEEKISEKEVKLSQQGQLIAEMRVEGSRLQSTLFAKQQLILTEESKAQAARKAIADIESTAAKHKSELHRMEEVQKKLRTSLDSLNADVMQMDEAYKCLTQKLDIKMNKRGDLEERLNKELDRRRHAWSYRIASRISWFLQHSLSLLTFNFL